MMYFIIEDKFLQEVLDHFTKEPHVYLEVKKFIDYLNNPNLPRYLPEESQKKPE